MQIIGRVRNAVLALTVAAWGWLCWRFWHQLVLDAADSPEIYTRSPGFQALNFLIQYFWLFLLLLVFVLSIEWLCFRLVARLTQKARATVV